MRRAKKGELHKNGWIAETKDEIRTPVAWDIYLKDGNEVHLKRGGRGKKAMGRISFGISETRKRCLLDSQDITDDIIELSYEVPMPSDKLLLEIACAIHEVINRRDDDGQD